VKKSLMLAAVIAMAALSVPAIAALSAPPTPSALAATHVGVAAVDVGAIPAVDKEVIPMTMRAKFKVQSITQQANWNKPGGSLYTLQLHPVSSGSDENKKFFEATPGGQIQLSVVNEEIGKHFPIGAEVYVDFTPASPPAAAST
jgi:opacity protein-like surface antigen